MSGAALSLRDRNPAFAALSESRIMALTSDTTPDVIAERLRDFATRIRGANPVTVAIARDHVARMLREIGFLDPWHVVDTALGESPAGQ